MDNSFKIVHLKLVIDSFLFPIVEYREEFLEEAINVWCNRNGILSSLLKQAKKTKKKLRTQ